MLPKLILSQAHPDYALYHRLRSRIDRLSWQLCVYTRNPRCVGDERDLEAQRRLRRLNMWLRRLVVYHTISHTAHRCGWIRRLVARLPRLEDECTAVLGVYYPWRQNIDAMIKLAKQAYDVARRSGHPPHVIAMYKSHYTRYMLAKRLRRDLHRRTRLQRRLDYTGRLEREITLAARRGWYIILATLTCNDAAQRTVWAEDSTVWTDYIRQIDRDVGIAACGSVRAANRARRCGEDYHRYAAVIQRGEKHGRLHIHIVHMMRALPRGCQSDPNAGLIDPYRREICGFRKYWLQYGIAQYKMVRVNASDAYARAGYRWPVERLNDRYVPITGTDPGAVAGYLARYLGKELDKPNNGGVLWRTRQSRQLGQQWLPLVINQLTHNQRSQLLRQELCRLTVYGRQVPVPQLRLAIGRQVLRYLQHRNPRRLWRYCRDSSAPVNSLTPLISASRMRRVDSPLITPVTTGRTLTRSMSAAVIFDTQRIIDRVCTVLYGAPFKRRRPPLPGGAPY